MIGSVDNSTIPVVTSRFSVLRCSLTSVSTALRCSKICSLRLGLANCQQTLRRMLGILGVLFIAACSLTPVNISTVETYTFDPVVVAPVPGPHVPKTIMVAMPTASEAYDTEDMAYQKATYHLAYYTYHRWVATPAQLLQPLLVNALQDTQHFRAVVSLPAIGDADLRLDVQWLQLEQVMTARGTIEQVVLNAQLTDVAAQRIVAAKRFSATIPTQAGPEGAARAVNAALASIIPQLTQFVLQSSLG